MLTVIMLLVGLLGAPAAYASATVYKCTHDGKVSFTDLPCRDGQSVVMPAPPVPEYSARDRATLARQGKELARLEKEHRKEEALAERARERASRAAAAQNKKCAALKLQHKWAAEDARAATDKQAAQARIKVRRAAEKMALECPA